MERCVSVGDCAARCEWPIAIGISDAAVYVCLLIFLYRLTTEHIQHKCLPLYGVVALVYDGAYMLHGWYMLLRMQRNHMHPCDADRNDAYR
jgi:hypothetical protein